jgi:hypothetical protein
MATVTIRYQTTGRTGALVTRERTFPSEPKMQRWVARQEALAEEDRCGFVGVLAYSYDRQEN